MLPLSLITALLVLAKTTSYFFLHKKQSVVAACKDSLIFIPKIFLQQLVLYATFFTVTASGIGSLWSLILCATLFALAHLYLLRKLRKADAFLLIISSTVGGALFVYLYITYVYGLWLAFCVHLTYHTALDVGYTVTDTHSLTTPPQGLPALPLFQSAVAL
jgi:hypothetical protein